MNRDILLALVSIMLIVVSVMLIFKSVEAAELDNWSASFAVGTPIMSDPAYKSGVHWTRGDAIFDMDIRRWFSCNAWVGFQHQSRINIYDRGPNILRVGYQFGRCP